MPFIVVGINALVYYPVNRWRGICGVLIDWLRNVDICDIGGRRFFNVGINAFVYYPVNRRRGICGVLID